MNDNNSEIHFILDIYTPEIYLIVIKNPNSKFGAFNISIKHLINNKNDFKNNNISDYIYCNNIEYSRCGNCQENRCLLIQCGKESIRYENMIFEKYDDICIPKNISNEEKTEICLNFDEVNSYRIFNKCNNESFFEFNYMDSNIHLIIILVVLIIVLIIIFYNKYLITKKKKPFNVPIISTETFFPSINNDKDNEQQKIKSDETDITSNFFGKYQNI